MVGEIIRDYIEDGGKKLVVPGFGTFMRKDNGEVIFVELLRRDDGVLRELTEDFGHYSEVEAMVMIDRFIFETKTEIERSGSAIIEYFGTLVLDDKGVYDFHYSPRQKLMPETAVQNELFDEPEAIFGTDGEPEEEDIFAGDKPAEKTTDVNPEPVPAAEEDAEYEEGEDDETEELEIASGSSKPVRVRVIKPIKIRFEELEKEDRDEPKKSEPGKTEKTEKSEKSVETHLAREREEEQRHAKTKTKTTKTKAKTSGGLIFLVAVVMVIAVAAIAYGVYIWTFNR